MMNNLFRDQPGLQLTVTVEGHLLKAQAPRVPALLKVKLRFTLKNRLMSERGRLNRMLQADMRLRGDKAASKNAVKLKSREEKDPPHAVAEEKKTTHVLEEKKPAHRASGVDSKAGTPAAVQVNTGRQAGRQANRQANRQAGRLGFYRIF